MEYRINRRTGDRISVIGLGTSYIAETEETEALKALSFAYEHGINYADLATANAQLKALGTDYIDYGFIHCLDEEKDWRAYQERGALSYLLDLKKQGVVHHIGLSSHTPGLVQKVLDALTVDQCDTHVSSGAHLALPQGIALWKIYSFMAGR